MPKLVRDALPPNVLSFKKKPGRYADGNGLYLHISPSNARWWVWRGSINGLRVERGIGSAQLIPLADARETALQFRRWARDGLDPAVQLKKARTAGMTFEAAALRVWKEHVQGRNTAKYEARWWATLKTYAFPVIGNMPVADIAQSDILAILTPIWHDKPTTARNVRQRMRAVFDWAFAALHIDGVSPVDRVSKALPKQRARVVHHAALPFDLVPEFMRRLIDAPEISARCIEFITLTACRSGEACGALWDEIDLESACWTVPAARMKAGREHRVPLAPAAVELLERLPRLGKVVFPGPSGAPIWGATVSRAMRKFEPEATVHGLRSSFRMWAAERTNAPREIAEMCLAHLVGSAVEQAYARSDVFEKRADLMQRWAAFCTSATRAGDVVELRI